MLENKLLLRILLIVSFFLSLLFSVITYFRSKMPYDESGVYFEEESETTYDTDGLVSYTMLMVFFMLLSGLSYYLLRRLKRIHV